MCIRFPNTHPYKMSIRFHKIECFLPAHASASEVPWSVQLYKLVPSKCNITLRPPWQLLRWVSRLPCKSAHKKVSHPCHSHTRQIPRFILVAELAFGPGLLTPPVFIPFSVSFIPCALRNQHSLMISDRRSSRQILPVGRSVLLPLLQDLPFLYPRSVHGVQTNGFSSMYSK